MTDNALATIGVWSYGLAAAGYLAFAVRLLLGWRRGVRALLLLAATLVSAAWALLVVLFVIQPGLGLWMGSISADGVRYGAWFVFLGALLQEQTGEGDRGTWPWKPLLAAAIALVLVLVLVCVLLPFAPPAMVVAEPVLRTGGLALRVGLAVLGLALIEQLLRRVPPSARWALKPLGIGLGGLFAFDLYLFADATLFGQLDSYIWAARGGATALVIPFLALATARNPTWTIEMHLSRSAVTKSTAVLVSAAFLLLVAGAGYLMRFIGGDWGRALQIEVLFLAALTGVLVLTSGRARARIRVFVSKHFFSYRYDYREEWLRFTRTFAETMHTPDMQRKAIESLAHLVESPAGALWLLDQHTAYRPAANWNLPAQTHVEPADGSLVKFLEKTGWIVSLPDYISDPRSYADLDVPAWLREFSSAWLVVPLADTQGLMGFVVLATPRTHIDVNWEVRDLLKAASQHAASYLRQRYATEALVEARKFDAFNRMSAFVVHDLKNLVAQLSLLLRNAERHRDNPEFQHDMLRTVQHVVDRMNQLMLQLRTGANPVSNARLINMEVLVRKVCNALERPGSPIALDLAPGVLALGHEERLDHVVAHIVQNSLDATSAKGSVGVRVFRDGQVVVVEVTDNGVGMSAEFIRERLFRPFESSKPTGMGIGVYESAQYISSIGGKIEFDSSVGAGTRVRITLSSAEAAARTLGLETIA